MLESVKSTCFGGLRANGGFHDRAEALLGCLRTCTPSPRVKNCRNEPNKLFRINTTRQKRT